jgi:hypothetical protein
MGATIITATFLFTSKDRAVAEMFDDVPHEDMNKVSVFRTYNINNVNPQKKLVFNNCVIKTFSVSI